METTTKLFRITPKRCADYICEDITAFLIVASSVDDAVRIIRKRVKAWSQRTNVPLDHPSMRIPELKAEVLGTIELVDGVDPILDIDFYSRG